MTIGPRPCGRTISRVCSACFAGADFWRTGRWPVGRSLACAEPDQRPRQFFRGNRHYDVADLGWVSNEPSEDGSRSLFSYDTTLDGNGNGGHPFFVDSPADLEDLLDYLASL